MNCITKICWPVIHSKRHLHWAPWLKLHQPNSLLCYSTSMSSSRHGADGYIRCCYPHTSPRQRLSSADGLQLSTTALSRYIKENTEVSTSHLTPEIKLHLLTPQCPLWYAREGEYNNIPDPFWAFYWPGGQALARFVLENSCVVLGKNVLDVGSGCGAAAIAAVQCGARHVTANDICPVAAVALEMNAALNNISMEISTDNLIGHLHNQWDVVLLGDMFYDEDFTNTVTDWLDVLHHMGKTILIGDPGRIHFLNHPIKKRLKQVAEHELTDTSKEENNGLTHGYVWTFI